LRDGDVVSPTLRTCGKIASMTILDAKISDTARARGLPPDAVEALLRPRAAPQTND